MEDASSIVKVPTGIVFSLTQYEMVKLVVLPKSKSLLFGISIKLYFPLKEAALLGVPSLSVVNVR